jgi:hypothetical protein
MEDENAESLLSRDVAESLGLIVFNVRQVSGTKIKQGDGSLDPSYTQLSTQSPEVFTGFGCLNDSDVHLSVDPAVKPVVQKARHVPYGLRAKVEQKLIELQDLDVIEKLHKPSK